MESNVLRWCRENALFRPGDTVYAAVSGGADSVAMLYLLRAVSGELGITLRAAHFNHRLRGAESDRDEDFVRELCRKLDVPLETGSGDAAALAAESGLSVEEAARKLRYAFFDTLPALVATAHTADDNAETVLLNLLRGTALKGLCGIPPRRGHIVRPVLCLTRRQIDDYLTKLGVCHVEDSTNRDDSCLRNRLRHHVTPLLRQENPSFSETVLRSTQLLRQDEDYLQSLADEALEKAALGPGRYDCAALQRLPQPVRRRALRTLLGAIRAPKLSASHLEAVDALLASSDPSARCALPGRWEARREYGHLVLCRAGCEEALPVVPVSPDGVTEAPAYALCVRCGPAAQCPCRPAFLFVPSDGLCIRPRQEGDALRLPGGRKSLKKLMIDRKIPAARRASYPVLADSRGVIGLPGLGWNLDRAAPVSEAAVYIIAENKEKED